MKFWNILFCLDIWPHFCNLLSINCIKLKWFPTFVGLVTWNRALKRWTTGVFGYVKVIDAFYVSKNNEIPSSISFVLCSVGMHSTWYHSFLWVPLSCLYRKTECTAQKSDSASSSAKQHSKYWALFIKGRHELSLNFDCSHYQNAATEILLAASCGLRGGWGSQTIRLLVSKCDRFSLRRVSFGMRWHGRHWALDNRLFARDNMVA